MENSQLLESNFLVVALVHKNFTRTCMNTRTKYD